MATLTTQKRPTHVQLPASKSGNSKVPVCTVTPLVPNRRPRTFSQSSTSPRDIARDEARPDRDVRRRSGAKSARKYENKSPGGNDKSMKTAIFDLLNYRPATPSPSQCVSNVVDITTDYSKKYRLMYLVVRTEQQQDHLREIISAMRSLGRSRNNIRLMIKIKEALLKLYAQILGIRDNDPIIIQQIGDEADIEEFICMVQNTCSAIEEIPKDGYSEDIDTRLGLDPKGIDIDPKHPRVRVKSSCRHTEWLSMFNERRSSVDESNNSNEICTSPSFGSTKLKRSKSFTIGRATNKLYSIAKVDQDNGIYPCTYDDTMFDDTIKKQKSPTSPTRPPGLVPISQMPTLQTMTKQHDPQLHSLMKEIDGLMIDVGVADNKRPGISFEELMWKKQKGSIERKRAGKKEGKTRTALRTEEDFFIEELDRLLEDAEK